MDTTNTTKPAAGAGLDDTQAQLAEEAKARARAEAKAAAKKPHQRTLTADYILGGQRYGRGRRLGLSHQELERAVAAGVVHKDEEQDAEVPVNDPEGNQADEQRGSGPAPDAVSAPAARASRKKPGERYSRSNR